MGRRPALVLMMITAVLQLQSACSQEGYGESKLQPTNGTAWHGMAHARHGSMSFEPMGAANDGSPPIKPPRSPRLVVETASE